MEARDGAEIGANLVFLAKIHLLCLCTVSAFYLISFEYKSMCQLTLALLCFGCSYPSRSDIQDFSASICTEQIEQDRKSCNETTSKHPVTFKINHDDTGSFLALLQQQTNVISGAQPEVEGFEVLHQV